MTLEYDDSGRFYEDFNRALDAAQKVQVHFGGTNKMTRESKLFKALQERLDKNDFEEFVQAIRSNDTEEGRKQLSAIFDPSLLEHETTTSPITTPNGEVIDPGTIMLVLVIFLCGLATVEVARGRRIKAIILPGGTSIAFEPVA